WLAVQERFLPLPPGFREAAAPLEKQLGDMPWATLVFFFALVPAFCEELFFRGYVLSGLRGTLGKTAAVLVVAFAFGISHHSVHRLALTIMLGAIFGLLVIQYRSIWPAILAHMMHNAIMVLMTRTDGLAPLLERLGFLRPDSTSDLPPTIWIVGAGLLLLVGIGLCLTAPPHQHDHLPLEQTESVGI
ncbi:MAG: CPBP family intramembrane glutamic endopeptidase, partial [Planctomycetota bacterium]